MRKFACLSAILLLSGCAMSSDVMDMGGGVYMISAHASPIRGGAAGANRVAFKDANTFCAHSQAGSHAIVIGAAARDTYQGSVAGAGNSFGGGFAAAGNTDVRFRCGS